MPTAKKLIIEARVNEYAGRERNANVPWTPQEIASDAVKCREAGASIVHFHGRGADGAPDLSAANLHDSFARIRNDCDILIHPTLGVNMADAPAASRLAPIMEILAQGLVPDFAPLDMGSSNLDRFDPEAGAFVTESSTYINTTATLRYFAEQLRAKKVKPYLVTWNIPMLRWIDAFLRIGWLDAPCFLSLGLGAETALPVHPATPAGLRAYLDCMPAGLVCEWTVILSGGNLLPMAKTIIEQGGHISIGLGDYAYPELKAPTNAELIREITGIAKACKREIATPVETREILQMHNG